MTRKFAESIDADGVSADLVNGVLPQGYVDQIGGQYDVGTTWGAEALERAAEVDDAHRGQQVRRPLDE